MENFTVFVRRTFLTSHVLENLQYYFTGIDQVKKNNSETKLVMQCLSLKMNFHWPKNLSTIMRIPASIIICIYMLVISQFKFDSKGTNLLANIVNNDCLQFLLLQFFLPGDAVGTVMYSRVPLVPISLCSTIPCQWPGELQREGHRLRQRG